MPSSTHRPPLSIPTISLSAFTSPPTSREYQDLVEGIRKACTTTGFFQLVDHGIPKGLIDGVFEGSRLFFDLGKEEKGELSRDRSVGASNRGYEVIGGQALEEGTRPDMKEGFYIGQDIPATDPRVLNNAFLMGPNLWPSSTLIPEPLFKEPMTQYFTSLFSLSLKLLKVIAGGMPYGSHVFDEFISNDPVSSIRLLHYPPQIEDGDGGERQLGAGAHTDFGAITVLLQDGCGGLQVWDYGVGEPGEGGDGWVDVVPVEGAFVVNVGDMLQMWTNGKYKSSLHRVINKSGKDRYSVPFFFDGNVDCVLKPLDGSVPKGKVLTVEEHMRERFGSTYGRGKKREDGVENYVA